MISSPCNCNNKYIGHNPARPAIGPKVVVPTNPGWIRCWDCGGLWDMAGNDVLAQHPGLILSAEDLAEGKAAKEIYPYGSFRNE